MQYTKQQLRDMSPPEYHYGGYWDGLYRFQKGDYRKGFTLVSANTEDLTNGNLEYFADNGYTRMEN